jgi:hypothetical protein
MTQPSFLLPVDHLSSGRSLTAVPGYWWIGSFIWPWRQFPIRCKHLGRKLCSCFSFWFLPQPPSWSTEPNSFHFSCDMVKPPYKISVQDK